MSQRDAERFHHWGRMSQLTAQAAGRACCRACCWCCANEGRRQTSPPPASPCSPSSSEPELCPPPTPRAAPGASPPALGVFSPVIGVYPPSVAFSSEDSTRRSLHDPPLSLLTLLPTYRARAHQSVRGKGRDQSSQYGEKDETCPVSTGRGRGGAARATHIFAVSDTEPDAARVHARRPALVAPAERGALAKCPEESCFARSRVRLVRKEGRDVSG